MGNDLPPALVEIENRLWKVLLGTINDPNDLPRLLYDAMAEIDVRELQCLEDSQAHFFQPGQLVMSPYYGQA